MQSSSLRHEIRELFRLALPLAAAQAGMQLMGLVDVAVLGRYGAKELAGAGLANAIFYATSIVGMGILFGVDPLIAQAVGAGDRARARRMMWQGIWLSLAVSAVLTLVLVMGAFAIPFIGTNPELIPPAQAFLLIRATGTFPYLLYFVIRSYLQAHHITRPLVRAMIVANVVNLIGDLLLVFGGRNLPSWTGPLRLIPEMGVAGAAIATVVCTILQFLMIVAALRRVEVPEDFDHRPNLVEIRQAFRVGLPIGLHMGAEIGIFALVALLAGRLGTLQLAAHQLVIGVASFTFTIAVGVAAAGTVRVGRAIGAHDATATRNAGFATFIGSIVVMGTAALAFALAPYSIARIITNKPEIIAAAMPLLLVAAVFQLSDGIQAAGAGVLRGAGDTRYTFWANVAGHWLVGLPIALYLGFSRGLGIVGLWWGLCAGLTVVAILLFIRFHKLSSAEIAPL